MTTQVGIQEPFMGWEAAMYYDIMEGYNPGAELGTATPTYWSSAQTGLGVASWDAVEHYSGLKCLKAAFTGAGTVTWTNAYKSEHIPVIGGTRFWAYGYCKASGTFGGLDYGKVLITCYDSAGATVTWSGITENKKTAAGDWSEISSGGTLPDSVCSVDIAFKAESSAATISIYFDEVHGLIPIGVCKDFAWKIGGELEDVYGHGSPNPRYLVEGANKYEIKITNYYFNLDGYRLIVPDSGNFKKSFMMHLRHEYGFGSTTLRRVERMTGCKVKEREITGNEDGESMESLTIKGLAVTNVEGGTF